MPKVINCHDEQKDRVLDAEFVVTGGTLWEGPVDDPPDKPEDPEEPKRSWLWLYLIIILVILGAAIGFVMLK